MAHRAAGQNITWDERGGAGNGIDERADGVDEHAATADVAAVVMAAGMMVMYLAGGMTGVGLALGGAVVFGVLTVTSAATATVLRRREHVLNPLWLATAVDMLAMTYMWLPTAARPTVLTWVFVAYLVGQMLAWATGLWSHIPVLRPAAAATTSMLATTASRQPSASSTAAAQAMGISRAVGLPADPRPDVRVSLAVMAASMGYMLAAM